MMQSLRLIMISWRGRCHCLRVESTGEIRKHVLSPFYVSLSKPVCLIVLSIAGGGLERLSVLERLVFYSHDLVAFKRSVAIWFNLIFDQALDFLTCKSPF